MATLDELQALRDAIAPERRGSAVIWSIGAQQADPRQTLDCVARENGFRAIAKRWSEMTRDAAEAHLAYLLHRDMAYGTKQVPSDQAMELARRVMRLLPTARAFSNLTEQQADHMRTSDAYAWEPLTDATFDSGIALVEPGVVLLVWISDED